MTLRVIRFALLGILLAPAACSRKHLRFGEFGSMCGARKEAPTTSEASTAAPLRSAR